MTSVGAFNATAASAMASATAASAMASAAANLAASINPVALTVPDSVIQLTQMNGGYLTANIEGGQPFTGKFGLVHLTANPADHTYGAISHHNQQFNHREAMNISVNMMASGKLHHSQVIKSSNYHSYTPADFKRVKDISTNAAKLESQFPSPDHFYEYLLTKQLDALDANLLQPMNEFQRNATISTAPYIVLINLARQDPNMTISTTDNFQDVVAEAAYIATAEQLGQRLQDMHANGFRPDNTAATNETLRHFKTTSRLEPDGNGGTTVVDYPADATGKTEIIETKFCDHKDSHGNKIPQNDKDCWWSWHTERTTVPQKTTRAELGRRLYANHATETQEDQITKLVSSVLRVCEWKSLKGRCSKHLFSPLNRLVTDNVDARELLLRSVRFGDKHGLISPILNNDPYTFKSLSQAFVNHGKYMTEDNPMYHSTIDVFKWLYHDSTEQQAVEAFNLHYRTHYGFNPANADSGNWDSLIIGFKTLWSDIRTESSATQFSIKHLQRQEALKYAEPGNVLPGYSGSTTGVFVDKEKAGHLLDVIQNAPGPINQAYNMKMASANDAAGHSIDFAIKAGVTGLGFLTVLGLIICKIYGKPWHNQLVPAATNKTHKPAAPAGKEAEPGRPLKLAASSKKPATDDSSEDSSGDDNGDNKSHETKQSTNVRRRRTSVFVPLNKKP